MAKSAASLAVLQIIGSLISVIRSIPRPLASVAFLASCGQRHTRRKAKKRSHLAGIGPTPFTPRQGPKRRGAGALGTRLAKSAAALAVLQIIGSLISVNRSISLLVWLLPTLKDSHPKTHPIPIAKTKRSWPAFNHRWREPNQQAAHPSQRQRGHIPDQTYEASIDRTSHRRRADLSTGHIIGPIVPIITQAQVAHAGVSGPRLTHRPSAKRCRRSYSNRAEKRHEFPPSTAWRNRRPNGSCVGH